MDRIIRVTGKGKISVTPDTIRLAVTGEGTVNVEQDNRIFFM